MTPGTRRASPVIKRRTTPALPMLPDEGRGVLELPPCPWPLPYEAWRRR
jgi:hypothetical protein